MLRHSGTIDTRHRLLAVESLLLALLLVLTPLVVSAGEITGHVEILRGGASNQGSVSPYARSRHVGEVHAAMPQADDVILAVVYLDEHPNLPTQAPPDLHPKMNQIEMTIVPHIIPIQVGTTVDFPNSDNVYHNLFSLSPTRKFDLGRYGQGDSKSETFKKVGEIRVYCDIHPHMNGVILVLPNAYFAEVHGDGRYTLSDVPPGHYTIHAWHESLNEQIREVTVPDSGDVTLDFVLGIQ